MAHLANIYDESFSQNERLLLSLAPGVQAIDKLFESNKRDLENLFKKAGKVIESKDPAYFIQNGQIYAGLFLQIVLRRSMPLEELLKNIPEEAENSDFMRVYHEVSNLCALADEQYGRYSVDDKLKISKIKEAGKVDSQNQSQLDNEYFSIRKFILDPEFYAALKARAKEHGVSQELEFLRAISGFIESGLFSCEELEANKTLFRACKIFLGKFFFKHGFEHLNISEPELTRLLRAKNRADLAEALIPVASRFFEQMKPTLFEMAESKEVQQTIFSLPPEKIEQVRAQELLVLKEDMSAERDQILEQSLKNNKADVQSAKLEFEKRTPHQETRAQRTLSANVRDKIKVARNLATATHAALIAIPLLAFAAIPFVGHTILAAVAITALICVTVLAISMVAHYFVAKQTKANIDKIKREDEKESQDISALASADTAAIAPEEVSWKRDKMDAGISRAKSSAFLLASHRISTAEAESIIDSSKTASPVA